MTEINLIDYIWTHIKVSHPILKKIHPKIQALQIQPYTKINRIIEPKSQLTSQVTPKRSSPNPAQILIFLKDRAKLSLEILLLSEPKPNLAPISHFIPSLCQAGLRIWACHLAKPSKIKVLALASRLAKCYNYHNQGCVEFSGLG